jgi:prepilin-type N-terminal cleavage/methylation domain-containing protein/prepilin-type processing-associated H-X9-DG protein
VNVRHKGFTLIELLVVIAIIAILAAMLFPVFARARESARKIQCLSNVKNIATAVQMYLVDYDRFPPCERNPEADAYFETAPGGGHSAPDTCCNRKPQANPFLRWQVIMDEYTKNRDVYRCPSAQRWIGPRWIVPNYGRGYLAYLKATEGHWGRNDPDCGGGPCCLAFPPGWGGSVTDSIAQHHESGEDTSAVETTICFAQNGLTNAKTSQVPDVSNCVVAGDSSIYANILGVNDMMYSLCGLSCGKADWTNCPDTQTCGLDSHLVDKWATDPSFRAKYTRHLGGGNVGFADGHAAWFNAEALAAITPYCECCSDETGYSGSTMHSEGRPIRGLCPYGLGP